VLIVSSPFIVIVFEELLDKEPPVPIISSDPFSIVSVPVESVNEISSVTVTFPSMTIVSEPVGSTPLLQFDASDQTPVVPPTQTFSAAYASLNAKPIPLSRIIDNSVILRIEVLFPMPIDLRLLW